ncbi:MAG: glycosyltransferase family 1 protein [Patescibacteria group bacterium]|jgi:glycosyltransferase involved in cell wall biosynthesis
MIIGIDASRANRPHKTGTEWYSFYLIKNLARLDKTNHYRLYLNLPPQPELLEAVKDNPNFSFKFLSWPFDSFWTLGRLSLEMIFARPDVLFIPAHTMPLFSPRRTINTIHDIAFVREQNLYRSRKIKTRMAISRRLINFVIQIITFGKYRSESVDYLYWSTAFALRHAGKIITVSNFTKQEIISLYPKTKAAKIRVVHNGYNDRLFCPVDDQEKVAAVLRRYGLEKPYFLYVGRLERKKNTPALIEALAILRDSEPSLKEKLVLIGDASFGYDEVRYAIDDFQLEHDVLMPGWVDEEDLPYIFSAASAFIFPSKHEGFGIPLLQAMACDVPVAASNLPVFQEVADKAVLYFDQRDKYAIATAMKTIVQDSALRRELIEKGRQRVRQFSWEKCARETLAEIENW